MRRRNVVVLVVVAAVVAAGLGAGALAAASAANSAARQIRSGRFAPACADILSSSALTSLGTGLTPVKAEDSDAWDQPVIPPASGKVSLSQRLPAQLSQYNALSDVALAARGYFSCAWSGRADTRLQLSVLPDAATGYSDAASARAKLYSDPSLSVTSIDDVPGERTAFGYCEGESCTVDLLRGATWIEVTGSSRTAASAHAAYSAAITAVAHRAAEAIADEGGVTRPPMAPAPNWSASDQCHMVTTAVQPLLPSTASAEATADPSAIVEPVSYAEADIARGLEVCSLTAGSELNRTIYAEVGILRGGVKLAFPLPYGAGTTSESVAVRDATAARWNCTQVDLFGSTDTSCWLDADVRGSVVQVDAQMAFPNSNKPPSRLWYSLDKKQTIALAGDVAARLTADRATAAKLDAAVAAAQQKRGASAKVALAAAKTHAAALLAGQHPPVGVSAVARPPAWAPTTPQSVDTGCSAAVSTAFWTVPTTDFDPVHHVLSHTAPTGVTGAGDTGGNTGVIGGQAISWRSDRGDGDDEIDYTMTSQGAVTSIRVDALVYPSVGGCAMDPALPTPRAHP